MKSVDKKPYFIHIVGEIAQVEASELCFDALDANFKRVLSNLGINILSHNFHEFSGGGLSIVYILSASHLAIHTWPEMNYLHFDLITCSPETSYEMLKTEIEQAYSGAKVKVELLDY